MQPPTQTDTGCSAVAAPNSKMSVWPPLPSIMYSPATYGWTPTGRSHGLSMDGPLLLEGTPQSPERHRAAGLDLGGSDLPPGRFLIIRRQQNRRCRSKPAAFCSFVDQIENETRNNSGGGIRILSRT